MAAAPAETKAAPGITAVWICPDGKIEEVTFSTDANIYDAVVKRNAVVGAVSQVGLLVQCVNALMPRLRCENWSVPRTVMGSFGCPCTKTNRGNLVYPITIVLPMSFTASSRLYTATF